MAIRCYLPSAEWDHLNPRVSGPQAHHLIRVLRVKAGDPIACFDGKGLEGMGIIQQVSRRDLAIRMESRRRLPAPPWEITLGAAIPQKGKFDQIVNEATQLGAARIIPLAACRGAVKGSAGSMGRARRRWVQISIEAGKQSGVGRLPEVQPATSWREMLGSLKEYDLVFIATLEGPYPAAGPLLADRSVRTILLLIGPEGDFTPEEIASVLEKGGRRFGLGPAALRCETAAAAAVSVISYLLRESRRGD